MIHAPSPLRAALLLLFLAPAAGADQARRLAWDELDQLVGKRVSIPLYDGCAVRGKVLEVQPDALLLRVYKSSNPEAHPKGVLRVPRATLHVLDVHKKGFRYGLTAPIAFVWEISGLTDSGPALDDTPDRGTTTIQIIPDGSSVRPVAARYR
jgi:hypothetical protein